MSLFLGVDTGGTYTDAVLIENEERVIASAKSLTTRYDLAVGIGNAVQNVLDQSGISPDAITLASLSTTLATNALVEGQGDRVGLVFVGFRPNDLQKHGIMAALKGDPVLEIAGGHNHAGAQMCPVDLSEVENWLSQLNGVSAFAVASQFSTRNPEHELEVSGLIREKTGKPVSASHQLSAKLNGPKRALTAVLNARLIGMIDRLIYRAQTTLNRMGISAPLMVVRGDGALISAAQAREKPIETILSGPAASIVGARWMTQADFALVSDIGGTTTDIALLRDGRPSIDPSGAKVGPFRTMVEAVAMRTTGLGGDSEVHFVVSGLKGGVMLGPRRLVPISLIAHENPEIHDVLDEQLRSVTPSEYDGRFVFRVPQMEGGGLSERDQAVFDRIPERAVALQTAIRTRIETQSIERMVSRGLIQIAGVTPSDASHVLGRADAWDQLAAEKAMVLFGRRRTGAGEVLSKDPAAMAQMIIDQLTHQTALALLESAFEEEGDFSCSSDALANHVIMQRGLSGHRKLVKLNTGLAVPVIGLGASAPSYYPAVGKKLGTEMILPTHAGVANAIGAVVGRVTMRSSASITSPSEGNFRVHFPIGPQDYSDEDAAIAALEKYLLNDAIQKSRTSGAQDIHTHVDHDIRKATIEAREVFIEATITVEASGRPRIAN